MATGSTKDMPKHDVQDLVFQHAGPFFGSDCLHEKCGIDSESHLLAIPTSAGVLHLIGCLSGHAGKYMRIKRLLQ